MTTFLAGIDLGGSNIKAAIADGSGELIVQETIPTHSHDGPHAVIDRTGDLIVSLLARVHGDVDALHAVGMGVPGLVDVTNGVTKFLPNLPTQWKDVEVASRLSQRLACPVRLLNDVRIATLGELRFGHGQQFQRPTMAFFSLGTGVGGGVVIDGRLRLGGLGAAGELGHQTILPEGPRCGCGNRGCLETLASGPAIAAEGVRLMRMGLAPALYELVSGDVGRVDTQVMVTAAQEDPAVKEALQQAAAYLGIAAANVVVMLHPDLLVLGGGVAGIGDLLVSTVKRVISQRVGMFPPGDIQVLQSALGEQAGVRGAIALAQMASNGEDIFSSDPSHST